jgi:MFS-type transporter involved in bile tolerance (Atg22 family)
MIIVLRRLAKKPVASSNDLSENQSQTSLPQENLIRAIHVQIRYIRYSRASRVLIVRAGLFTLCSSALLSLLPYFAKYELGLDSTGFGMLLGSFGMGAIIGGIEFLPRLRPKVSVESMIIGSIALLSMVTFSVGYIQDFGILACLWL